MSQHKAGLSNWTVEDKKLYWARRKEGLRGQVGFATVPVVAAIGSRLSRGKHSETRSHLRQQWRAFNRQQRKASARGE